MTSGHDPSTPLGGTDTLALVAERVTIGRRLRDTGGVRVTAVADTVTETLPVTVEETDVTVERVAIDRVVESREGPRTEGDVTILPVYEERAVVETRLVLVEEIRLTRATRRRAVDLPVELRRDRAVVERLPPLGSSPHPGESPMMDATYTGTRSVTAMFDTAAEAERAVARLRSAGVSEAAIRHTAGSGEAYTTQVDYADTTYRDQNRGFWDSLADFFFPENDRYVYAEGLARGSHMVTVTGFDAALQDTVVDILDDEGSIDLDTREEEWRSTGWTDWRSSDRYDERHDYDRPGIGDDIARGVDRVGDALARGAERVGDALTPDSPARGTVYDDGRKDRTLQMAADMGRRSQADLGAQQAGYAATRSQDSGWAGADDGKVEIVEEDLHVGTREVDRGGVRVRSYLREEPVSAEVDLRARRVHIDRRPVDRAATDADLHSAGRTIEARETAEEAVVTKDARVVEEIGLRTDTEVEHRTIQDTVRHTEVEIEDDRTGETSRLTGRDTDRGTF